MPFIEETLTNGLKRPTPVPTGAAGAAMHANIALLDAALGKVAGIAAGVWLVRDDGTSTLYRPSADTDAARGTALIAAVAAMGAHDVIRLSGGTFDIGSSYLVLPNNGHLSGAGMDATSITTSATRLLTPGNSSCVQDLTLSCLAIDGTAITNEYQAFSAAIFRNVRIQGETDAFILTGLFNSCTAQFFNCVFDFNSDGFVLSAGTGHQADLHNCVINGVGSPTIGSMKAVIVSVGAFRMYGGSISIAHTGSPLTTFGVSSNSGTAQLHDVAIRLTAGGGAITDLHHAGGIVTVSGGSGSGTNGAYTTSGTITRTVNASLAEQTLTDGASIAWNVGIGPVATVTLGGNRTVANPTNLVAGGTYILIVKQDATGSRTLAYGTAYKWPGGTVPTLTTTASATDILTFVSDGTNLFGVAQKGFA